MAKGKHGIFWRLAGVDPGIAADCPPRWRRKYRRAAVAKVMIGLMCVVSGAWSFRLIFGHVMLAIPFSLFFALIVINLYRLVLTTVGNPHIPHSPRYRFPFGSFVFRSLFLLVLGIFIVKPIELLVLEPSLRPHLDAHREAVIAEHNTRLQAFAQQKVREIFATGDLYVNRANTGGYLMARLNIMHREFPWVWALTILLEGIFLWPFWARVAWRKRSAYEKERGAIEKALVLREYERFRALYIARMAALTGRTDIWEAHYHDMPFRNEPIEYREIDFLRPGSIYAWARIHIQEKGEGK